ncbi:hypothetical protein [Halomonas garicola]|uniref:hypothetical protein n=1 Tax=Halomonas garicola TaxID=1690008 RepID=UPI0028990334|nr:hypothetical protein [Halomonas garicola]
MAAVFLVVVGCFIVFFAAGRRVLRVLLPGVLLIGTCCYCWRCRGQGEKVPVVVIVRVRLFIFACSAVLLLFRAEAKAAIALLLLALRLSVWVAWPSVLVYFSYPIRCMSRASFWYFYFYQ